MGALATTFWLARKGDQWIDAHIAAFISVSAPWQGSPTALKGAPRPVAPFPQVLTHLCSLRQSGQTPEPLGNLRSQPSTALAFSPPDCKVASARLPPFLFSHSTLQSETPTADTRATW